MHFEHRHQRNSNLFYLFMLVDNNDARPKIRSPNRGKNWYPGRITVPANLVSRLEIWGARDNGIPPRSTPGLVAIIYMPLLDANHLQGNDNYFILVVSQAVIRTKHYPETLHGYWNKHVTEEYKIMLKYFKKSTSTLMTVVLPQSNYVQSIH